MMRLVIFQMDLLRLRQLAHAQRPACNGDRAAG